MTTRPLRTRDRESTPLHPAQADFLVARLSEELDAALLRPFDERGLRMLADLRATISAHQQPDQMFIDVLTVAYASHPDYNAEWDQRRCA